VIYEWLEERGVQEKGIRILIERRVGSEARSGSCASRRAGRGKRHPIYEGNLGGVSGAFGYVQRAAVCLFAVPSISSILGKFYSLDKNKKIPQLISWLAGVDTFFLS
jgi:hypothetical protein